MIRYGWFLLVLVLLVTACGPSAPAASETTVVPGGPAVSPAASSPQVTPTTDVAATETPRPEPGLVTTGSATSGGSIDLGRLTPAAPPAGGGEAVELPGPGLPRPEVKMASLAMQDLAIRLGIDISEITVVETEMVEWPDAGLGCPAEGMMYAAVITPGYRIALLANGETYIYHTDSSQQVVLCLDGQAAPPMSH